MFFRLKTDTITPDLRRMMREVQRPRTIFEAGAKVVQRSLIKHLRALQARGNEKGWPAANFFARGANSVEKNVGIAWISDKGAEITIADPRFVHRIQGGRVTPKRSRLLAIPLRPEAYALAGKGTIRESAPQLKLVRFPAGLYLIRELSESRRGTSIKRTVVEPWFKLVPSVTHRPHPEEMPNQAELAREAGLAMDRAARLLLRAN